MAQNKHAERAQQVVVTNFSESCFGRHDYLESDPIPAKEAQFVRHPKNIPVNHVPPAEAMMM